MPCCLSLIILALHCPHSKASSKNNSNHNNNNPLDMYTLVYKKNNEQFYHSSDWLELLDKCVFIVSNETYRTSGI